MRVLGVDGWKGGWLAVALEDGAFAAALTAPTLTDLLGRPGVAGCQVIGIDIPIGLSPRRFRAVDEEARRRLGPRASTLFVMPPAAVLEEADYAAANALCRQLTGKGVSKQAHALRKKVLEAAAADDPRLHEVHPELSFAELGGGGALALSKRTWGGQAERRRLLRAAGIELPAGLGDVDRAPPDDVLDAAVAAWSADRIARGRAVRIGGGEEGAVIWT